MTLRQRISELLKSATGVDIEDRLRSFAPRLDISFRRTGGLNIKQKGRINILIIPPDATELVLGHAKPKQLVSKSEERGELRGFTREDLQGFDAVLYAGIYEEANLLGLLEVILPQTDLEALSISMMIKRTEALAKEDAARKLRQRLRKEYGERGNRILLFYATGLMVEFMSAALAMAAFTPTVSDIKTALAIWNLCLDHMEHAVFVNRQMSATRALGGILYRLEVDGAKVVLVFALGKDAVSTAERALAQVAEMVDTHRAGKKACDVHVERYTLHGLEAIVGTISRLPEN